MKAAFAFFLVWVIAGCSFPVDIGQKEAALSVEKLRYAKDSSTGLCFAFLGQSASASSLNVVMTNVPCTEAVLSRVEKTEKR